MTDRLPLAAHAAPSAFQLRVDRLPGTRPRWRWAVLAGGELLHQSETDHPGAEAAWQAGREVLARLEAGKA